MFPLKLQDDKLQWKLAVCYYVQMDEFVLHINGRAFLTLPYKASLANPCPMNIENGFIYLNGVIVHERYTQYTEDTFYEWCDQHSIQSVTEATIYLLKCSSSDAVNSVFDDLGRYIDAEEGLKKFEIIDFKDRNTLEEWPLSQLVMKSPNLEQLTISRLNTTAANRS